jgi:hypothetical protein
MEAGVADHVWSIHETVALLAQGVTTSLASCCNSAHPRPRPSGASFKTGNYQTATGPIPAGRFLFRRERDTEMVIYIVAMESADGQKSRSICATGRTRRECIQNAVDEASARDGIDCRPTATTNLKKVVEEPLLPPLPSPRKIYVSPKPRPRSK